MCNQGLRKPLNITPLSNNYTMHMFVLFQNGWTPIMDAAMHGHAEVIKLLLEAGAIAIKAKEVSVLL